jgi:two-component system sensor kinase FixL
MALIDNGPGFGDEDLSQLPLSTTKSAGSGIGFSVARTNAENHGGSLEIGRSADLDGALVRLRLAACA